jgi:hypothetical protein
MSQNQSQAKLDPCDPDDLKTREMFKKDFKLSCPVLDDNDVFQKALKIAKLESEWEDYYELAYNHADLDQFRRNLVNQIITKIKTMPEYHGVQNIETPFTQYLTSHSYLKEENTGKNLISIDLVSGNFQSLRYFSPNLVLNKDTYTDFIKEFTKEPSLIRSKYFRQLIFGLLKPRVFMTVQKHMIAHIIDTIFKKRKFTIVNLTNDEVVLESGSTSKEVEADKELIRTSLAEDPTITYQYRIDDFNIEKVPNSYNEPWYVKYSEVQGRRIMGVHLKYLFQVYNYIEKIPNQPKDLWWRERGRLCCLLEPEEFKAPAKKEESQ